MTSDNKAIRQNASYDFKTLDDIIAQRNILAQEIENSASKIANHWAQLTKPPVTNSKAETNLTKCLLWTRCCVKN